MILDRCTGHDYGRIERIVFIKHPSRYLVKKYGSDKAFEIMMERAGIKMAETAPVHQQEPSQH